MESHSKQRTKADSDGKEIAQRRAQKAGFAFLNGLIDSAVHASTMCLARHGLGCNAMHQGMQ